MTCQDHDRDHCPSPRCHVLAVCMYALPFDWTQPWPGSWHDDHEYHLRTWASPATIADAVATRLVVWMRWRGERRAGPLRILVAGDVPRDVWDRYGPGFYHPLDAVMAHADRVAGLGRVCRECMVERAEHGAILARMYDDGLLPPEVLRVWPPDQCTHDGINWATVAVCLDWLLEQGWSWDTVHEWRKPTWGEWLAAELVAAQETIRNWRPR